MSPRTPGQYEEIRESKKSLIMETALKYFANDGYHVTTINHIAEYAGISKGLMYNYFESKEALLKAIINKSVSEVFNYFDINRDGFLSEEEFEFFIRKMNVLLKEKRSFWRLLVQLLMQNDVRDQFLRMFVGPGPTLRAADGYDQDRPVSQIMKMISDYFIRKKELKGENYDPVSETNLFLVNMKGFAITVIYMDEADEEYSNKVMARIIELFK